MQVHEIAGVVTRMDGITSWRDQQLVGVTIGIRAEGQDRNWGGSIQLPLAQVPAGLQVGSEVTLQLAWQDSAELQAVRSLQ